MPLLAALFVPFFCYRRFSIDRIAALFFVFTYFLILLMISDFNDYSIYKYVMIHLKLMPFFILGLFTKDLKKFFLQVFFILVCFNLYAAIYALALGELSINTRLSIGIFNPIWLSRGAFELLVISIVILNLKWRNILVVSVPVIVVALFSGSKGPILSFLVVIALYFASQKHVIKFWIFFPLFVLLSLVIIHFSVESSYIFQRFFTIVPEGTSSDVYEKSRLIVWPKTLSLIFSQDIEHLIFGNGIGMFGSFYNSYENLGRFYPHNLLLELTVEFGLLFTLVFSILVFSLFRRSNSNVKYLLLFHFLNAQYSGDILLNEFFWFYLAILLSENRMPYGRSNLVGAL